MSTYYVLSPLLGTRNRGIQIGPWPHVPIIQQQRQTRKWKVDAVVLPLGVC